MFDAAWILAQNHMEHPFALADALAYKFGYRGSDAVTAYPAEAHKFSLLRLGLLDKPSCKLLVIDGMEYSIFPIEDNFIVGISGNKKDLGVEATARAVYNHGYSLVFVEDAISGANTKRHDFFMNEMFPRIGHVRSSFEIASALSAL